jgi:two-component system cell cycle response regulator DivK
MYTKTVLVVVEDADVRATLVDALRSSGYGVFEASAGMKAVESASLHRPDLVLMDLDLKDGPDGWTTIKFLSDSARTESIPVVVLSERTRDGDLRRAALLGCRALVAKTDPAAAVAASRAVLGPPRGDVAPETPKGVIRRRYRRSPVSAA